MEAFSEIQIQRINISFTVANFHLFWILSKKRNLISLCRVSGGRVLMSRPRARLGVVGYLLILHIWLLGTIL